MASHCHSLRFAHQPPHPRSQRVGYRAPIRCDAFIPEQANGDLTLRCSRTQCIGDPENLDQPFNAALPGEKRRKETAGAEQAREAAERKKLGLGVAPYST